MSDRAGMGYRRRQPRQQRAMRSGWLRAQPQPADLRAGPTENSIELGRHGLAGRGVVFPSRIGWSSASRSPASAYLNGGLPRCHCNMPFPLGRA